MTIVFRKKITIGKHSSASLKSMASFHIDLDLGLLTTNNFKKLKHENRPSSRSRYRPRSRSLDLDLDFSISILSIFIFRSCNIRTSFS